MSNNHISIVLLSLCLALTGCVSHTVSLLVHHKGSDRPIQSAVAIVQRHDYSMLNSKTLTEDDPILADAQGRIVLLGVREKDTIMVKAPGLTSALVGIRDRSTLSCYAPFPESGSPFPAASFTNISAVLIVPLETRRTP